LSATSASNDDFYRDDDYWATAQQVNPCDDGVVQVTALEVSCDSPYTFYYGNGANRNSPVCDYGDKATITVNFTVTEDIDNNATFYAETAAFSPSEEQLYKTGPFDVCEAVGGDCQYAGSYQFKIKTQFAYIDGSDSKFVPLQQMSFGYGQDGDTSLGGVNIECEGRNGIWSVTEQGWIPNETFFTDYGILIGTVAAVVVFAGLLWRQGLEQLDDESPLLG
jgi:hypothetical protein